MEGARSRWWRAWLPACLGCLLLIALVRSARGHQIVALMLPASGGTEDLPRVTSTMTEEELAARRRSPYVVPAETTLGELIRRWDHQVQLADLCHDPENRRQLKDPCTGKTRVAAGIELMLPTPGPVGRGG